MTIPPTRTRAARTAANISGTVSGLLILGGILASIITSFDSSDPLRAWDYLAIAFLGVISVFVASISGCAARVIASHFVTTLTRRNARETAQAGLMNSEGGDEKAGG